jgi:hypothetical protein
MKKFKKSLMLGLLACLVLPVTAVLAACAPKGPSIVNASAPNITGQPQAVTVYETESITLSVTAAKVLESDVLSYQWYKTANTTAEGTAIEVASNATADEAEFKIASASTADAGYYYVVVTNTNTTVNGTQTAAQKSAVVEASVSVRPETVPNPVISTQPAFTGPAAVGDTVILTVAATASAGTLSYQWYSNDENNTTTPTAISGATGAAFTVPTGAANVGTAYYYVVVTNSLPAAIDPTAKTVTGNIVAVTVEAAYEGQWEATEIGTPTVDSKTFDELTQEGYETEMLAVTGALDNAKIKQLFFIVSDGADGFEFDADAYKVARFTKLFSVLTENGEAGNGEPETVQELIDAYDAFSYEAGALEPQAAAKIFALYDELYITEGSGETTNEETVKAYLTNFFMSDATNRMGTQSIIDALAIATDTAGIIEAFDGPYGIDFFAIESFTGVDLSMCTDYEALFGSFAVSIAGDFVTVTIPSLVGGTPGGSTATIYGKITAFAPDGTIVIVETNSSGEEIPDAENFDDVTIKYDAVKDVSTVTFDGTHPLPPNTVFTFERADS